MIAYFDTSAIVPLVVEEPGSSRAASLWGRADRVVTVRLAYAEARAAFAQARRLGRLTARQLRAVVTEFEGLHDALDVVEVDEGLVRSAADLAEAHALRGYDAVHLAAALRLRDPDLVVVAGDAAFLEAARDEGLATAGIDR